MRHIKTFLAIFSILTLTGRGGALASDITGRGGALASDMTGRGGALASDMIGRGGALASDLTGRGGALASDNKNTKIIGGKISVAAIKARNIDNQMQVGMNFVMDSLKMPLNRRIVLTPYVASDKGDSVFLRPVVINDRRQQIMYDRRDHKKYDANNPLVVTRRGSKPQQLAYSDSTPYAEWMRNAHVGVSEDLCGCGNINDQEQEPLKRLYTPKCSFIQPVAAKTKTYQMHGRAFIDFPVDRTELHPDYRNNPRELAKIIDTINVVKKDANMTITNIDIHGYASPESPYDHNAWLAKNRAATLKNYVRQLVRLDDSLFSVHYTPEDWDGLRRFVSDSNIDKKNDILALASDSTIEPDRRELLIKTRYPEQYRLMLATWYPALRHSDYTITCSVRPFSVDEARQLIKTRPQLLSQNEMYMVAETYEPGSKEFNEVMEIAVRMFPDDPTANLNAACSRLDADLYDEAKPYLDKAGTSAEADNARGVYFWNTGDTASALAAFKSAADKGSATAKENLDELSEK